MKVNLYAQESDDVNIYEFAYSAPDRARSVGPYARNTYLLHIVKSGVCHFCGRDVGEGYAFIIAQNKLHSFSVKPGYSHYWFAFKGPGSVELLGKYMDNPHEHAVVKINDFAYAKTLLAVAFSHCENRPEVAKSAFFGVLSLLERRKGKEIRSDSVRVKMFIDNNYQRKISMEDVAAFVCLSEKYMCARFKRAFGLSPKQYLQEVRMKKARSLIKNTDFKIAEVALSVGYSCQLAFSAAFRKHCGVSPSAYRDLV